MTIDQNLSMFVGLAVEDYRPGVATHARAAWRVRTDYQPEVPWKALFEQLVASPGARDLRALIVGNWGEVGTGDDASEVVRALVSARPALAGLTALFVGDIVMEEAEISWIEQTDVSPIFSAYPSLEHFQVRGGKGLSLGQLRHAALRALIVESGGLDASVVRQVAAAELPKLEHLELWLGSSDYGATSTLDDLAPLLQKGRFPALKTLALRDSEQTDAIATAVASAPILDQIEALDLSLGTLGDDGAKALLASGRLGRLKRLDLHHHYLSEEMTRALQSLGNHVDVGDPQSGDPDERYVAVSE